MSSQAIGQRFMVSRGGWWQCVADCRSRLAEVLTFSSVAYNDEVIADWVGHWTRHHGQEVPEFWNFDAFIKEKFDLLKHDEDFWMSIPPKLDPKELPFEPVCYVTSRVIPTAWTMRWLDKHKFPAVPVHTVGHNQSKVEVLKNAMVDLFVDDRYENFIELTNAGICCFLFDAPHNRRYDVGYKRIQSLKDLFQ